VVTENNHTCPSPNKWSVEILRGGRTSRDLRFWEKRGVKNLQLFPERQALLNLSSKTLVHCIAWEIAEN